MTRTIVVATTLGLLAGCVSPNVSTTQSSDFVRAGGPRRTTAHRPVASRPVADSRTAPRPGAPSPDGTRTESARPGAPARANEVRPVEFEMPADAGDELPPPVELRLPTDPAAPAADDPPAADPDAKQPANPDGDKPVDPDGDAPADSMDDPKGENGPAEAASLERTVTLAEVVESVRRAYPSIRAAFAERQIADGERIAALGAFDTKSKAHSINQPLGFYENYRHLVGLEQATWWGGEVFAGYRLGRGVFEPWYQERVTDHAGEFKAGVVVPLLQNRNIDERRQAVLNAEWDRRAAEPEIRLQLLDATLVGSLFYWDWVAAGRNVSIQNQLLELALVRQKGLETRVERGALERIALVDNRRLILSRETKVIAARQKLQQAAIKLSLFLRAPNGAPFVAPADLVPTGFPRSAPPTAEQVQADTGIALANRPEGELLDIKRRQLDIDRAQAQNLYRPKLDATLSAKDNIGRVSSSKKDKAETVLEAGVFFELPLQRRKALGKLQSVDGKMVQLAAKRQLVSDKIVADVNTAYTGLVAAAERIERAVEAVELAERLAEAERKRYDLGESDLLSVNLREQQATDAALAEVEARLEFHQAEAAYNAALGGRPH